MRGIKVCYPSNAADLKGLLKAAFLDPNPVVMFEHKGLYWSKVPGTDEARTIEPSEDYIIPLGKGNIVQQASEEELQNGNTLTIITYGMGVYWAFALGLSGKISAECFQFLDQPVKTIGARPNPAVPLNMGLEKAMLPNVELVAEAIEEMLRN